MNNIRSTLATVWRIAAPYFRSEDKWAAAGCWPRSSRSNSRWSAIDVLLNQWNNRFYNALQDKNWDAFVREIGYFCVLAASYIALAVYQLYLNQWLQIRWRRWLTGAISANGCTAPTTIACSCRATPPTTPTSASPKTSNCSSIRRSKSASAC